MESVVQTPGGCFVHFSAIAGDGYRVLSPGQVVDLEWEEPGFLQDGLRFRTVRVVP